MCLPRIAHKEPSYRDYRFLSGTASQLSLLCSHCRLLLSIMCYEISLYPSCYLLVNLKFILVALNKNDINKIVTNNMVIPDYLFTNEQFDIDGQIDNHNYETHVPASSIILKPGQTKYTNAQNYSTDHPYGLLQQMHSPFSATNDASLKEFLDKSHSIPAMTCSVLNQNNLIPYQAKQPKDSLPFGPGFIYNITRI